MATPSDPSPSQPRTDPGGEPSALGGGSADRATAIDPLLLPVVVGLVLPGLIILVDRWRRGLERPSVVIGAVLTLTGLAIVVRAAGDHRAAARAGSTSRGQARPLVTTGLFAHCRNPVDLGVLAMLAGLSMASRSPLLGLYLLAAAVVLHLHIVLRREPLAAASFPETWPAYRRQAPRWFPRIRPPGTT